MSMAWYRTKEKYGAVRDIAEAVRKTKTKIKPRLKRTSTPYGIYTNKSSETYTLNYTKQKATRFWLDQQFLEKPCEVE